MPEPHADVVEEEGRNISVSDATVLKKSRSSHDADEKDAVAEASDLCAVEQLAVSLDSYNFDAFISRMRHPSCRPVLENIKRFLKVYFEKLPESRIEDMVDAYTSFYNVIKVRCLQSAAWQTEDVTLTDRANALEGLESLLLNQLHDRVLGHGPEEREMDNFLERKMALYAGWIQLRHLDVPEQLAANLQNSEEHWVYSAITEFQKMSVYRTPRDKLVCILNGCRILNSLVQGPGRNLEMSADDFLPVLIYTVIRANPPQLSSNVNYITRFRASDKIAGETAYFFTHLMAVIEFVKNMDRASLTIETDDFDVFMKAAHTQLHTHDAEDESDDSFDRGLAEKLDLAEMKAEQFFLKAKEAFKMTGERAGQALSTFKESALARRSVERFNRLVKELTQPKSEKEPVREEEQLPAEITAEQAAFEDELARALSLSLVTDDSTMLSFDSLEETHEKDSLHDQTGAGVSK